MAASLKRHKFAPKLIPIFQPRRYKVLYGGRGGAKSWGVAQALLLKGVEQPLRIMCGREVQNSIEESVYQLLKDMITFLELDDFYTASSTDICGRNGTRFIFKGLRSLSIANIKSVEGMDIVWVEEAHVVSKKSWDVLTPTVRKPGSEIWITFNPELDTDETYDRFVVNANDEDMLVIKVTYADNPWFPEVLEKERKATLQRDPLGYRNIWEGEPRTAVEGAIYAQEMSFVTEMKRIRNVPYDPLIPVHTIWDLGGAGQKSDKTAILFVQVAAREVSIIDYIQDTYRALDSYVKEIESKPYRYNSHWLPWDGGAASRQTGMNDQQLLGKLGLKHVNIVPQLGVEEGIRKARLMFPRVYFDKEKTRELQNALKRYKRAVPITTGEPGAPVHDNASHGADAFRYLSVCVEQLKNTTTIIDPYKGFR